MARIRTVMVATLAAVIVSLAVPTAGYGQQDFFEFPLSINGMTTEDFIADEARAIEILNTLEGIDLNNNIEGIRQVLQTIGQGFVDREEVPTALRGIGGFPTVLALRALLFKEAYKVQGRIRDYVYVDADHSGHLAVDVRIQYFASAAERDAGGAPIRAEFFHWDIDVDGAYQVHERVGPRDNPFPGVTLLIPAQAIASIWDPVRDLKYKLHAKGTGIVVRHVYRKVEGGTLELLPPSDFRYTSTAESCIDLLFNPFPPEFDLPPQKGYCLGRCDHPFIVNTGG